LWATVLALLLVGFLVVEVFEVRLFTDPTPRLVRGGALGAILTVALLAADAVLPVPAAW
jgi:hypothetical protein